MRPTTLFFWAVVWPYELLTMKSTWAGRIRFVLKNALTLIAMVVASLLVARWWYGQWHFLEYNFIYVPIHFTSV